MLRSLLLICCFFTLLSCSSSNAPDEIPSDLTDEISDLESDIFKIEGEADNLEASVSADELDFDDELDDEFEDPDQSTQEVSGAGEEGITEEELDISDDELDDLDDTDTVIATNNNDLDESDLDDLDDSELDLDESEGSSDIADLDESELDDNELDDLDESELDLDEGNEVTVEIDNDLDDGELGDLDESELDLDDSDSSSDIADLGDGELDDSDELDDLDEGELDDSELDDLDESEFADLDEGEGDLSDDELDLDGLDDSSDEVISENFDDDFSDEVATDLDETTGDDFGSDFENISIDDDDLIVDNDLNGSGSSFKEPLVDSHNKVLSLDYDSSKEGGVFVVKTKLPTEYSTEFIQETNQFIVELENTKIDKSLQRPFLTKDFKQNFGALNSYQGQNGEAKLVIQLKNNLAPFVTKSGNKIAIAAGEPGQAGVLAADALRKESDGGVENEGFPGMDSEQAASSSGFSADNKEALKSTSLEDYLLENTNFYGKPISIQVKDANIVDVIHLISEEVGANLVVSDGVTGKVSIKLKQVPWDQALITIMKTRGLGYVRSGSVLRIAPLSELKAESTAANEVQNARKSLTPFHVKVFPLSYASPETLETKLKPFLTVSRGADTRVGKVISEKRSSSIIVNDTKEVIQNIEKLIKELDRPPLQVMIEAKVVEATKEFTKEFGSSLFNNLNSNNQTTNVAVNNNLNWNAPGTFGNPLINTINISGLNFFGNLQHILKLNEIERKIKVLSAPKILAMNNEQSTILQVSQVLNNTTTVPEGGGTAVTNAVPIDVELRLEVKPQITSDSNVIMDMLVKRQFPGAVNADLGATPINTREAKTKVIVGNNRTAVIGGIYQVDNTVEEGGVPVLKNIPLIKWLFGNKIKRKIDSELMVFVTPRILNRRGRLNPVGKTPVANSSSEESLESF